MPTPAAPAPSTSGTAPAGAPDPRSLAASRAVFRSGDGLRGWGCLAVFVYHAAYFASQFGTGVPGMAPFGHAARAFVFGDGALAVFFGLSGYLIARPFARAWMLDQRRPSLRSYAGHRARRILPVMWVVAPLAIAYYGVHGSDVGVIEVLTLTAPAFFSQAVPSMSHAWSLLAEAGYYAVLPVLALGTHRVRGSRRHKLVVGLGALGLLFAGACALRNAISPLPRYEACAVTTLYAFLPGAALALVEPVAGPWCADHVRRARTIAWGALALSALCYLGYIATWHADAPALLSVVAGPRLLAIAGSATGLLTALLVAQWATGWAPRALTWAPARWLGVRSYPFYLVHLPVLLAIERGHGVQSTHVRFAEAMVLALPITLAIAVVIHAVVERPILDGPATQAAALRHVANRLRAVRPAVAAVIVAAPVLLAGGAAAAVGGFAAHEHSAPTGTMHGGPPNAPFHGIAPGGAAPAASSVPVGAVAATGAPTGGGATGTSPARGPVSAGPAAGVGTLAPTRPASGPTTSGPPTATLPVAAPSLPSLSVPVAVPSLPPVTVPATVAPVTVPATVAPVHPSLPVPRP